MGDDVISLVKFLDFNNFHVVGHSMGGGIAQYIALQIPKYIRTLTLISSSFRIRPEEDPELSDWLQSRHNMAEELGMIAVSNQKPLVPNDSMIPQHRLEYEQSRLSKMSVDAFLGTSEGFKVYDGVDEKIEDIATPTLIICGELDSEIMLQNSIALSELIPNAELIVIPTAQHSPQWEFPSLVNQFIESFMRRH